MMRNTNTSNFTYQESQFGPNVIPPPISQINTPTYTNNLQSGISTFQQPVYATQIRSPQYAQSFTSVPMASQQAVMESRGPMIIDQRQITAPRTQQITQYVQSPQPVVHEIVQPKIIEETVVHHSRLSRGENPTLYSTDPQVETVNRGKWMSYYDGQKQIMAPPTKSAAATKTCCGAPLLALLGLLALGGLIAAIVLGARGANTSTAITHSESSQGIPIQDGAAQTQLEYPENSITQKTVIIQRSNETNKKNTTQVVTEQKSATNSSESSSIIVSPVSNHTETSKQETKTQTTEKSAEKSTEPFSVSPIIVSPSSKQTTEQKSTSQTVYDSNEGVNPIAVSPSTQTYYHSVDPIVVQPTSTTSQPTSSSSTKTQQSKSTSSLVSQDTEKNSQKNTTTVPAQKTTTTTTTVYREVEPLVAQPVEAHLKLRKYHQ